MKKIVIDPVTRIEGHAKITIHLDKDGGVADTAFHVTQVRGFEKFTEGRPFYEMPSITARICGICPISHLLASQGLRCHHGVRIPPTARSCARLLHCAQFVQSHALSFFHLSAPDLLLGMDSDPAQRNILGVIEKHPGNGRDGIALRKFGQQVIERPGQRAHASFVDRARRRERAARSRGARAHSGRAARGPGHRRRTLSFFKGVRGPIPGGDRQFRQRAHACMPAWWTRRRLAALRRPAAFRRRRRARSWPIRCRRRTMRHYIGEAVAAVLLSEGALFQAAGLSPRASTGSVRWRG